MSSEKKHKSLKEIFRSSSQSLNKLQPTTSHTLEQLTVGSHRFFLRKRSLKTSITPQTSSSSLTSLGNWRHRESGSNSPAHSDDEKDKKDKTKRKHKHHNHSLRRFFKILKPEHGEPYPPRQLPLSLTSDLAKKYDLGRLIGSGASGSVNLVTDKKDVHKIYAVKKFRPKLKNESDQDYKTKVKNEFLIGEYLTHQNLIHTMELFHEDFGTGSPEYYIVMEYCPYDFFNLVMSGLMHKEEIYCYVKQIIDGVAHLHDAGIAHRDLKLDNCVVDTNGVLKIIDFGSAFQFRKDKSYGTPLPSDKMLDSNHKLVVAKGIVGSDPYLSPEVFEYGASGYDARLADVWSIAIIFCCMILKRFPWKIPRNADPSYRAFAGLNNMDEPVKALELESSVSELSIRDKHKDIPKYGPERLLRLLPSHSRKLVKGMLEVDCAKRFLITDVVNDTFYKSIDSCHYLEEKEAEAPAVDFRNEPEVPHAVAHVADALDSVAESEVPESIGGFEITESVVESEVPNSDSEATKSVEGPDSEATKSDSEATKSVEVPDSPVLATGTFVKAANHKHHLVTEEELEKLNAERERARKIKENGLA